MKHRPPQTKTSSSSIMNCFQHTPESCGALINPRGEPHTKKHLSTNTPNRLHNARLLIQAPCTSALAPHPSSRLTSYAPRTRAHFTPQHWLLCHLGLY